MTMLSCFSFILTNQDEHPGHAERDFLIGEFPSDVSVTFVLLSSSFFLVICSNYNHEGRLIGEYAIFNLTCIVYSCYTYFI